MEDKMIAVDTHLNQVFHYSSELVANEDIVEYDF